MLRLDRLLPAYKNATRVRIDDLLHKRMYATTNRAAINAWLKLNASDSIWLGYSQPNDPPGTKRGIDLPKPTPPVRWIVDFGNGMNMNIMVHSDMAYIEPYLNYAVTGTGARKARHPDANPFKLPLGDVEDAISITLAEIQTDEYPPFADSGDKRWRNGSILPMVDELHHGVNLRCIPATVNNQPLATLYAPIRQTWYIDDEQSKWLQFQQEDGYPAWASKEYVQTGLSADLLPVEWISQVDANAPGANDCGQTCVLMLLRYYGKASARLTVKTLTNVYAGRTGADTLMRLAAMYGLNLALQDGKAMGLADALRESIAGKNPAIALVNYRDTGITPAENPTARVDPGLHWAVVVGASGDWFYLHDPLWIPSARGGNGGAYVPVHKDALAKAYRGAILT